jgi:hypothetical protein
MDGSGAKENGQRRIVWFTVWHLVRYEKMMQITLMVVD